MAIRGRHSGESWGSESKPVRNRLREAAVCSSTCETNVLTKKDVWFLEVPRGEVQFRKRVRVQRIRQSCGETNRP